MKDALATEAVVMAPVHDISATDWIAAIASAIAALGAVGTLFVAIVAAYYAKGQLESVRGQLEEARILRREQAQPYVAIFMIPDRYVSEIATHLVVKNFGQTAAYDVRLRASPTLQRSADAHGNIENLPLFDVLPTLAPGQQWDTVFDIGTHRDKAKELPDVYDVELLYQDAEGRTFSSIYRLDWGPLLVRHHLGTKGIHHIAGLLRELVQLGTRVAEGNQLRVSVRDGVLDDETDDWVAHPSRRARGLGNRDYEKTTGRGPWGRDRRVSVKVAGRRRRR